MKRYVKVAVRVSLDNKDSDRVQFLYCIILYVDEQQVTIQIFSINHRYNDSKLWLITLKPLPRTIV